MTFQQLESFFFIFDWKKKLSQKVKFDPTKNYIPKWLKWATYFDLISYFVKGFQLVVLILLIRATHKCNFKHLSEYQQMPICNTIYDQSIVVRCWEAVCLCSWFRKKYAIWYVHLYKIFYAIKSCFFNLFR